MKFSYKLIAVILVAILVFGIYRLGVENNAVVFDAQGEYNKTENIYLWYSDPTLEDFYTTAAVAFHEENEDVRVIPVLVTSDEYLEYVNETSVEGENYPDLFMITNDQLEKAYLAGLASQIDERTDIVGDAHFSKVAQNAVTYHGKKVGYPLYFETSILVYNKTYLKEWLKKVKEEGLSKVDNSDMDMSEIDESQTVEESQQPDESEGSSSYDVETLTLEDLIPESIEDIKTFADEYDAGDGVEGVFKWDVSDVFYNYFFVGNYMIIGGEAGDDASNVNIYNDDTIKCMNIYQNLNQFFSIDAETSSYDKMIEDFIDGKFVYSIATSDVIDRLKNAEVELAAKHEEEKAELDANIKEWEAEVAVGEMTEDDVKKAVEKAESEFTSPYEFGYARVPMLSDELKSKSLSVTDVMVVNGYSEHKYAANRFAAYLSTKYSDKIYAKTGKIAASTDAGYEDPTLLLFQEEYANSMPLPKLIEASNFWVQLEITFLNAWTGNDVDKLLSTLSEQIGTQISGATYKETTENKDSE